MTLAMSWDEWAAHDGIGLAERVRKGDVTAAELAAQAAAGIAKVNPRLDAVVEVFDDVVADPLKDGMDPEGVFAGLPYLMKDLGPTLKGRLQEFGSMIMQGNRPGRRQLSHGKAAQGRPEHRGPQHHARVRRVQLGGERAASSRATRGTSNTPPAARRPARRRPWPRACCRCRTPPTAAAPSAFPRA
jgi:hypothetical protein